MPDDPTFTLQRQHFVVTLSQGGHDYSVGVEVDGLGAITLRPWDGVRHESFTFARSQPDTLLALGRLFIAVARKFGAMDA